MQAFIQTQAAFPQSQKKPKAQHSAEHQFPRTLASKPMFPSLTW